METSKESLSGDEEDLGEMVQPSPVAQTEREMFVLYPKS
jgi:hypothetical protein